MSDEAAAAFVGFGVATILWTLLLPNVSVPETMVAEAYRVCEVNGGMERFRGDAFHGKVFCVNGAEFKVAYE